MVSAAGCQTTHGQSTGSYWDDTSITTAVKTRLASDRMGSVTRIDVETTRGVVHLNGMVDSVEEKARAERMAADLDGVSRVVNNLQVQR
jgi:osmotically-inducible protein OsmY